MTYSKFILIRALLLSCLTVGIFGLTQQVRADSIKPPQSQAILRGEAVTGPLTADQIVARYASANALTSAESAQALGIDLEQTSAATYEIITRSFTVNPNYHPSLQFYCETSESGWFHGIVKVLKVSDVLDVPLNKSLNDSRKLFNGKVYFNLEDPNRIYYSVSGDFYDVHDQNIITTDFHKVEVSKASKVLPRNMVITNFYDTCAAYGYFNW